MLKGILRRSTEKPQAPKLSWSELFNNTTFNFLEFLLEESPKLSQKYGDIMRLSRHQFLVTGREAFKTILKTRPEHFTKRNRTYQRIQYLFGDGLIVSDDKIWENHREPLHEFFHRDKLASFADTMTQTTEAFIEEWKDHRIKKLDIVKEMTRLTLTIAFRAFCSHSPTTKELNSIHFSIIHGTPHLSHALCLSPYVPTPMNLLFFWSMKRIDRILTDLIEARKKKNVDASPQRFQDDYLDLLIRLQTKNPDASMPHSNPHSSKPSYVFSDSEVLDELKTILLTGHETSACALIWTWHLLNQHPDILELLEEELDRVLKGRTPTLEDCAHLPMTKAIFLETLRLYPPIWCLPRKAIVDEEIGGYFIPKDSELILNVHALHRNPNYWDNPNAFLPGRFLGESGLERQANAFLPFSLGPRTCIGTQFAMTEGILLIAMISQQFRLKGLYNSKKIRAFPYLSLRPPKKLWMKLVEQPT